VVGLAKRTSGTVNGAMVEALVKLKSPPTINAGVVSWGTIHLRGSDFQLSSDQTEALDL